ncbi:MAG: alpha-glucan family phosphorylase [Bacteroidota bacterium]
MSFKHPYPVSKSYSKSVAYFSMEFAIDQSLKIYSGGLGFLAGSHMRSAYELKQNVIGIGMLWKYGYYDQVREPNGNMGTLFQEKHYSFLQETDIEFEVTVHNSPVKVKAFYLAPEVFGTAPIYLLSTNHPENDHLAHTITERLYDNNLSARIAQYIILGVGGVKLLEALNHEVDIHHFNEAHALPAAFYLHSKEKDLKKLKEKTVFTTHTPVKAGNEENDLKLLQDMSFFSGLEITEVEKLVGNLNGRLNHTLALLRISKKANAVSSKHQEVANEMWGEFENVSEIEGITNAQNRKYWTDEVLDTAAQAKDVETYVSRKKGLKKQLFDVVADQCGKHFDPDVLTVVWARRFADYKRVDLILRNNQEFMEILQNEYYPIQFIWAGKPYPFDYKAINMFNHLVHLTRPWAKVAVLTGYELGLSALLKKGSDVWLNNPRIPLEASGTSGMTASMNGSINVSTNDGWIKEFAKDGKNGFYVPEPDPSAPDHEVDEHDRKHLLRLLKEEAMPLYYDRPEDWVKMSWRAAKDVDKAYVAKRMAKEYYEKMYS